MQVGISRSAVPTCTPLCGCIRPLIPLYPCSDKTNPFPYSHFKTHTAVQSDISCNNQSNPPANSYTHLCVSSLNT